AQLEAEELEEVQERERNASSGVSGGSSRDDAFTTPSRTLEAEQERPSANTVPGINTSRTERHDPVQHGAFVTAMLNSASHNRLGPGGASRTDYMPL
ncbi:unnamed protein product, partial [Amoebophrya sp. A25]